MQLHDVAKQEGLITVRVLSFRGMVTDVRGSFFMALGVTVSEHPRLVVTLSQ